MKVIKKILGIVLMLAGIAALVLGIAPAAVGCYNMYKWGFDVVEVVVLIIFILIALAGVGIFYWGIRLFLGRRLRKRRSGPVSDPAADPEILNQNMHNEQQEREADFPAGCAKNDTQREPRNSCPAGGSAASSRIMYTLLVEDVFVIPSEGCVVSGILKGGKMALKDSVWLLHADGSVQPAEVVKIEAFMQEKLGNVISADGETRIGILLRDVGETSISPGCVVSSIFPNTSDVNRPVENPRLKGLLAGREDTLLTDVRVLIRRELMSSAKLLAVVVLDARPEENGDGTAVFRQKSTMSLPYLTSSDERHYQPVFTDWDQLRRWENEIGNKPDTILMSGADVAALVNQNDTLQGAVINPFTDNLILEKTWFAE